MAWIETTDETDASASKDLRAVYDRIAGARGKVSNIMRVQSGNPQAMDAHLDLYQAVMFNRSGLRRAERELIAVVVSAANECAYCVEHHAEALRVLWRDSDRVKQVIADYQSADLSERERALCDYASGLTRAPGEASEAAINSLRLAGLSDKDILDANLVLAYFNFVNRIALGLGVAFSKEEVEGFKYQ